MRRSSAWFRKLGIVPDRCLYGFSVLLLIFAAILASYEGIVALKRLYKEAVRGSGRSSRELLLEEKGEDLYSLLFFVKSRTSSDAVVVIPEELVYRATAYSVLFPRRVISDDLAELVRFRRNWEELNGPEEPDYYFLYEGMETLDCSGTEVLELVDDFRGYFLGRIQSDALVDCLSD